MSGFNGKLDQLHVSDDVLDVRVDEEMVHEDVLASDSEARQAFGEQKPSFYTRAKETLGRHKLGLLVGATAVSAVATVTNNPVGELYGDVKEAAPWVGGGVVASEVAFVAGAIMMAASVKEKISNPLKIRQRLPEIAKKAHDSKLFTAGFWTNTVGAVGDFAVISAGMIAKMPVESYPMLAIPLLDLSVTVAVRRAIHKGVKGGASEKESKAI